MIRHCCILLCLFVLWAGASSAQSVPETGAKFDDELRYVLYLSRHGVRSPTGKPTQYNQYSKGQWPEWTVQPGYLTPHGFRLMELFGAYDRLQLAGEGLFSSKGCSDAAKITVYADSDQRTRETGKALAQGLMPGCGLTVQSLPEGTNDALFHALDDASVSRFSKRAEAAVAGRIGGEPGNVTRAYEAQLKALDHLLVSCGTAATPAVARTSLFDVPATLSEGSGDHLVTMKGPINTASTLVENLLLEYTEGMDIAKVGWGCVGHPELESLISLHTAATDFTQRTPEIGAANAANLLLQIDRSIQQAVSRKPVHGAIGKPGDVALFLIGHDTNQENIAGALGLTWIIDGRRDDTPPGGSLVFEVWQSRSTHQYGVRVYFTAQTLEQMRDAVPLTGRDVPERVPVFVPGCSREDMSCDAQEFSKLLQVLGHSTEFAQSSRP
jgi:4-phytase/acid phosphatase